MTTIEQAEAVRKSLIELLAILDAEGEGNWRRGIKAAVSELTDAAGAINLVGFDNARSIYNTMTAGGRGFSEYFIWVADEEQRLKKNRVLDDLRLRIWTLFNP